MAQRVITRDDAVAAARDAFLRGRRFDMAQLAGEMAVSRATLYRVAGSTEKLLGDVIDGLGRATLAACRQRARADGADSGVEHVLATSGAVNLAIVGFEPLRTLIDRDPELAFRVLFMPAAAVHERGVAQWRALIAEVAGPLDANGPADLDRVSYMFVRIGESMIYSDLLAGREPDLPLAADLQRRLLAAHVGALPAP